MAALEFWIQIENHPWDVCPTNITDRMTGQARREREQIADRGSARRRRERTRHHEQLGHTDRLQRFPIPAAQR